MAIIAFFGEFFAVVIAAAVERKGCWSPFLAARRSHLPWGRVAAPVQVMALYPLYGA